MAAGALRARPRRALAVSGGLFARRALLLVAARADGQAVRDRARRRRARPAAARRRSSCSASASCSSGSCPGLMHAFIFWGFLVLFPTIVDRDDRRSSTASRRCRGSAPGLVRAARRRLRRARAGRRRRSRFYIRKVVRPGPLRGQPPRRGRPDPRLDHRIVVTLLLWHAARIALGLNEYDAGWSPVANALSSLFGDGDATEVLERVLVWAHVLLILGFLAYLPRSKHLHIVTAAINVYFGRTRSRSQLRAAEFRRGTARGGDALRHRDRRGPDVEADDGRVLVHRVRALPGRVSCLFPPARRCRPSW